jgi:hypothetical protein
MIVDIVPSRFNGYESAVEEAVAACDGNVFGALKALIIANEILERDLQRVLACHHKPGDDRR